MSESFDAVVVGSGPNGLAAAVTLAQQGASVLVLEAHSEIGGGTRTAELTLPGFHHDVCSACHPMGVLSPFLRTLPLAEHGLTWLRPEASVAHPLDDGTAVMLWPELERMAEELGGDFARYRQTIEPFLANPHGFLDDAMGPLGIPSHPLLLLRYGWHAWRSATSTINSYQGKRMRALFAGCAAHSVLPLEFLFTSAFGWMFLLTAHVEPWPVAAGGSQAISGALASLLRELGGEIRTNSRVEHLGDLPTTRVALFDTSPRALANIAESALPERYVRGLRRYRYGPGSYKLDFALDGPIPWTDPRCHKASTVHLGGTADEIALSERQAWNGERCDRPYVLVVQQSELDPSRAPEGKHTGYAYCHVPAGSDLDMRSAIVAQIERFAPGFRDRVLATHVTTPADFERYDANFIGGAVTGGAADLWQLFTRPVVRPDPYSTPNPRLYLCSASTPPGGGVHGMCGFHAARSAMRQLPRLEPQRLA